MRIGMMIGGGNADEVIKNAQNLEKRGFDSVWMGNFVGHGLETLHSMGLIARETNHIKLGTAVIPIYLHHPVALAHQAISIQKTANGRFTLGIGLSHPTIVSEWLGLSNKRPITQITEYVSILQPLLNGNAADSQGDYFTANASVHVSDVERVPLLIAAMGPQMLKLAGELSDGTVTYLTGLRTLESHIIPKIKSAAAAVGHITPRIVAGGLPMALVDDVGAARASIAKQFAGYGDLPTYRAMLDREGVADPADVAIVGDANVLKTALMKLEDMGVTDLMVSLANIDDDTYFRTLDFLAEQF